MIRKIQLQLHQGGKMKQPFTKRRQFVGNGTPQLTQRQVLLRLALRSYQIRYRFGLRQIHLTVEKSPTGELTRLRHTSTGIYQPLQQGLLDIETAVTSYLYGVFTRKRMRGTKNGT